MKTSTLLNRLTKATWVCALCGGTYGTADEGVCTWHYDKCDICLKKNVAVTEPRDFDYLNRGKRDLIKLIQVEDRKKNKEKIQKVKEKAESKVKKIKAKAKEPSMRDLQKELKRITHKIVRLRYDNCYSCDKFIPLNERQCGHYHTDGGNPGTRYDFDNLRTQHRTCNHFYGGDAHFGARLLQEIGQGRFLALDMKRKIKQRWSKDELRGLIEERKVILSELESGTENAH